MREIVNSQELYAWCGDDLLCRWAAQDRDGRVRAWASEDRRAMVAARPALSGRDRLVVWGADDAAVPLVREVLAEVGPAYRPFGDGAVIDALVREIPALTEVGGFGWMDCTETVDPTAVADGAEWLPQEALPAVSALVEAHFPASHAKPGVPGVERWAGVRDDAGRLAAVGALAWSAPAVGFLSGVAVRPEARNQGMGRRICGFLLAEALRSYGAAGLMVDDWNHSAVRLYRGMGMRYRALRAAAVEPAAGPSARRPKGRSGA